MSQGWGLVSITRRTLPEAVGSQGRTSDAVVAWLYDAAVHGLLSGIGDVVRK